jgi:hypothetical protein
LEWAIQIYFVLLFSAALIIAVLAVAERPSRTTLAKWSLGFSFFLWWFIIPAGIAGR